MATTQIAFTDKQLEAELQTKRRELDRLHEKLRGETRTLDAAKSEQSRVTVAIENGATGKETELSRAKESVELAEIRVGGLRKQVAPIESAIKELSEELGRRQAAAERAAHERDFAARVEKGKALALRIREAVALLCTGDMRELEELRASLITEFPDIGGVEAASGLREIVIKPSRGLEKLRNPEVHLAQLEAAGLVAFGFTVNDRLTGMGATAHRQISLVLGEPPRLTVVPMRPRE
jgi:hypothetical protein